MIHLWKGPDFEPEAMDVQEFIQQVIDKYWGEDASSINIEKVEQIPGDEDDEFLNYFD